MLACRYEDWRIKLERKHEQNKVKMAQERHTTFQEVFLMTSLANSVKAIALVHFLWHPFTLHE